MMSETELLQLVRGPALQVATLIFLAGVVVRVFEIIMLGRRRSLAEARGSELAGGLRTIITRMFPDRGTMQRSTFNVVAGYIFHIGFFITLFFFAPHILLFDEVFGASWPSLPSDMIDAVTVVTIITLVAVLVHRISHRVMRYLSRFQDYLVWLLTLLPMVTGYMAFHRIGFTPPLLVALHIASVELLMVVFPFTKLMHAFTFFFARYYTGAMAGRKGVRT